MRGSRAAARRLVLRELLSRREVLSQDELVALLGKRGHRVTQTTVSRDLAAIQAAKRVEPDGRTRYEVRSADRWSTDSDLIRVMQEFVLAIEPSRNLVVLKTPPGAANPVAAAIDCSAPRGVLGTIAGDDTLLVITRSDSGGSAVARRLAKLMEA